MLMTRAALFLAIAAMLITGGEPEGPPSAGQRWRNSHLILATSLRAAQAGPPAATTTALDFEVYRTRVEPILLSPRRGNARCIACHSRGGGNSFLEPLSPGSTTYSEEQSRRNFERIQRLVVAGEPLKSPLLVNPLAEEAGGSHWHAGGKHWVSQDSPEWQILASWVRGAETINR